MLYGAYMHIVGLSLNTQNILNEKFLAYHLRMFVDEYLYFSLPENVGEGNHKKIK